MSEKSLGPSLAQSGQSVATWQLFLQSFMLGAEKMPHKHLWNELNEWRDSLISTQISRGNLSVIHSTDLYERLITMSQALLWVLGFDSGTAPLPWEMYILMQKADNRGDKATEAYVVLGRTDVFELWCWRRLLRVPRTAGRSNQSILKEINPEYSLEGLMLKLHYFDHLM